MRDGHTSTENQIPPTPTQIIKLEKSVKILAEIYFRPPGAKSTQAYLIGEDGLLYNYVGGHNHTVRPFSQNSNLRYDCSAEEVNSMIYYSKIKYRGDKKHTTNPGYDKK